LELVNELCRWSTDRGKSRFMAETWRSTEIVELPLAPRSNHAARDCGHGCMPAFSFRVAIWPTISFIRRILY
jgi:hypothetical protein